MIQQLRQERNDSNHSRRDPIWKIALYMIFMGLIAAFGFAHAYDPAIKIGLSPTAAHRLPSYAFVAGVVLGSFRICRHGFAVLLTAALFCWLAWMFGLGIGALLIIFGVSTEVADWLPPIFFWLSVVLTAIAFFAGLFQKLEAVLGWRTARRTNQVS
jgi:hypothetical protein